MRIYFVGMHNKKGMKPLDSKTYTGGIIDALINELGCEAVKTNLCDTDYMPNREEVYLSAIGWHDRYDTRNADMIVLLGNWVNENFVFNGTRTIKIPHPGSIYGTRKREEYIKNSTAKIREAVTNYLIK